MSVFGDVFSIMGTPRTGRSKISKYLNQAQDTILRVDYVRLKKNTKYY